MPRFSLMCTLAFTVFSCLLRGHLAARPACCGQRAEVFAEESGRYPEGQTQAVELCRFVTAYKVGLEGLVDATPYSPLLKAAAEAQEEIVFWTHIDTWVGNHSGHFEFFVDQSREQCSYDKTAPGVSGDGNGWGVSADLVFWPEEAAAGTGAELAQVSTQPFESITLASGHFGDYHFGDIEVQEGVAVGGGREVLLDEPEKLDPSTVEDVVVMQCPTGKRDIEEGVEMLEIRDSIEGLAKRGESKDALQKADEYFKTQAERRMSQLQVTESDPARRVIIGRYEMHRARPRLGTEVFLDYPHLKSEECDQGTGRCDNVTYPFVPVGRVFRVTGDGKVEAKLDLPCIPTNITAWTPRFRIPDDDAVMAHVRGVRESFASLIQDAQGKADNASLLAVDRGTSSSVPWVPPLMVHVQNQLKMNTPRARLRLKAALLNAGSTMRRFAARAFKKARGAALALQPSGFPGDHGSLLEEGARVGHGTVEALTEVKTKMTEEAASAALQEGEKVCLLTKRRQGRLFEHNFTRPNLADGERAVLQVAFSGHGWSGSEEKCGEFCHMSYRLEFDGEEAGNVSVWRGDCGSNPISNQFGTWPYPRNGWCPGTVVPGLFLDVTEALKKARQVQGLADGEEGTHKVTLYISVRPGGSRHYAPYTNIHMFPGLGGDIAKVYVGMTLFLYRAAAVAAIMAKPQAVTAAEKAIRDGISNLKAWVNGSSAGVDVDQDSGGESMLMEMDSEASSSAEAVDMPLDHIMPRPGASAGSSFMEGQEMEDTLPNLTGFNGTNIFDMEKRFPWYLYDNETEGPPGAEAGVIRVPVITGKYVQFPGARLVTQSVPSALLPKSWSRVALHLKLFRPSNLHYDHWDRVGSMGLFVKGHVLGA